ncbi:MAG: hypothetical protein R2827_06265 [Bdellovibrionales bacterium]
MQFDKQLAELKPEDEQRLINDCFRRVKQEALKRKSKELAFSLNHGANEREKKLEELRDLQKSKIGSVKDLN